MADTTPPAESHGAVKDWLIKTFDPWLESKRGAHTLMLLALLLAAIPIVGIGLATTRTILPYGRVLSTLQAHNPLAQRLITATFKCAGGKAIRATFSGSSVELILSDGRHLTLPQALSASGARYANADESFVFWNKGNAAFIDEGDQETYTACATND